MGRLDRRAPGAVEGTIGSLFVSQRIERDTGDGIPPEHLPSIFERFYKVEASRGGTAGSGLGLSIVKAIVERHGGSVRAESSLGAGTMMRMLLPSTAGDS